MKKCDLAYRLYTAGVIAFDDYQCVDCGGSNVLVDSFYDCALEIEADAGRDGFLEGVRQMAENEIGWFGHDADSCANHYHASILAGKE